MRTIKNPSNGSVITKELNEPFNPGDIRGFADDIAGNLLTRYGFLEEVGPVEEVKEEEVEEPKSILSELKRKYKRK